MKITRRTDYAIHLLADLSRQPEKPQGLRNLADKHKGTYAFARTVQQGLLKASLIKTSRGINGGIVLAKPLDQITLLEVFEGAQDPLEVTFENKGSSWCSCEGDNCFTDDLWLSSKKVLRDHFATITLGDLIDSH